MTDNTYRTVEITGIQTRTLSRRFRVPAYVSEDAFLEAIDNDQLDTDFREWNDHLWNVRDEDWKLVQGADGLCFKTLGRDEGGEDVDGIFPDKKTIRVEITSPAATVYTLNVPAGSDLDDIYELLSGSSSYSAVSMLINPKALIGLIPDGMPATTRVVVEERDFNEHAHDATAEFENLRASLKQLTA
jgi:hypothetical protein